MKSKVPQKPVINNTVSNCIFYGVKWDKKALASLDNVTKALLNITELFKATGGKASLTIGEEAHFRAAEMESKILNPGKNI